jgi:serine kinase of HPr protein (carbohydrate metabolism regulator)
MAILVEVAARNHLLKRMGVHTARAFTAGSVVSVEGGKAQ